ncbi:MAG: phage minor head protein, partial [Thermoplasmata archaeon]
WRSNTIARTETLTASNRSALIGYKRAGVEKVEWLLAPDYDPKDDGGECEPLDGAQVESGQMFPDAGVDAPPLHPNCRCTIIPVVDGKHFTAVQRKQHRDAMGAFHAQLERQFLNTLKRAFQTYQDAVTRRLRAV